MKERRLGTWCVGSLVAAVGLIAIGCGGTESGNGSLNPNAGRSATGATGGDDGSGGSGSSGGSTAARGGTGDSGGSGGATGGSGGTGGDTSAGGSSAARGGSGGSGGSTAGSGGSGAAPTDAILDEIEGHCERSCDAQYALECAPANSNRLICETSCVAQTGQLGNFCMREYADYVACQADGGYACVQNTPYPNSTCAVQQLAFSQCAQHLGCKRECALSRSLGCTDATQDDCVESCITNANGLPDAICTVYSEQISMCRATQQNPTCNGEQLLTPASCAMWVLEVGSCIEDETSSYCDGWCWAANSLGCGGEDCAADCAAKSEDMTCGMAFQQMMDCGLFFGDAACTTDMGLMANGICDSEVQTYQTCLSGMTTE
jgi:hypothetical protein